MSKIQQKNTGAVSVSSESEHTNEKRERAKPGVRAHAGGKQSESTNRSVAKRQMRKLCDGESKEKRGNHPTQKGGDESATMYKKANHRTSICKKPAKFQGGGGASLSKQPMPCCVFFLLSLTCFFLYFFVFFVQRRYRNIRRRRRRKNTDVGGALFFPSVPPSLFVSFWHKLVCCVQDSPPPPLPLPNCPLQPHPSSSTICDGTASDSSACCFAVFPTTESATPASTPGCPSMYGSFSVSCGITASASPPGSSFAAPQSASSAVTPVAACAWFTSAHAFSTDRNAVNDDLSATTTKGGTAPSSPSSFTCADSFCGTGSTPCRAA
eukprot:Rhum_TRINITY_DN12258_c0_g1::Rhum_TRINITY_DN12258_c0_g1_i1::g.50473::m.50473